jgi:hypothetical protein
VVSTYTYAVSSIHNKCPHPFKAFSPSDHNHSKEHDTVSWGGFNLHICRLPIRNKQYHPNFGSKPQEVHGEGCRREEEVHERSNAFGVQSIESWPIRNRYPPSHTLGSIPSEHGAFALGKAAQSCATHGEANRWGSRIYGDTVSTIQNPNRYRLHSLHTHRELCVCEVVNSQQGGVGVTLCLQWYWYCIDKHGDYIPSRRSFVKFKVERW